MTYLDSKDDVLHYSIISVFSLATIAVAVYIFLGTIYAAYVAIVLYAVAFGALSIVSIRKLFVIYNFKDRLDKYTQNTPEDVLNDGSFMARKQNAERNIKIATRREILRAVFSGLFAIFTIVVLVLF